MPLSAIPAAAYSKAQSYVPLVQSRSAHFIDPWLRAILETSFTPDDNDLFLSNLADTPILAIHGCVLSTVSEKARLLIETLRGADENVPTWHTRTLVDTLKTLKHDANVTLVLTYLFQPTADRLSTVVDSKRIPESLIAITLHSQTTKYKLS